MTTDGTHHHPGLPDVPIHSVDLSEAETFFRQHAAENPHAPDPDDRFSEALVEFGRRGTFSHTTGELEFGAQLAWRNANRCIGRLYWRSLIVRDRRSVRTADGVAAECVEHLRVATNGGRIRPVLTLFAPDQPGRPAPRLHNAQLIRYAGYQGLDSVIGDPAQAEFTRWAESLGWSGKGTDFDVLPLAVETPEDGVRLFDIPGDAVLEVPLTHPEFPWFAELDLRWHAVPAISSMPLRIGGITYRTAPFNGWYMGTEIGSRNLVDADRYDRMTQVGRLLGLDVDDVRSLWKDRVLVEINRAVLHSFDAAGVKIADHHHESELFMRFVEKEERAGRTPRAEWSWVVPPLSSTTSPVYHRYYDDSTALPGFLPSPGWTPPRGGGAPAGCPHHAQTGASRVVS